jgi:hypothetical protein
LALNLKLSARRACSARAAQKKPIVFFAFPVPFPLAPTFFNSQEGYPAKGSSAGASASDQKNAIEGKELASSASGVLSFFIFLPFY